MDITEINQLILWANEMRASGRRGELHGKLSAYPLCSSYSKFRRVNYTINSWFFSYF